MKSKLHPDGCPDIILSAPDLAKIRSAWSVFEELAHRGRNGAMIGTTAYAAGSLENLSEFTRGILIAADMGRAAKQQPSQTPQQSIVPEQLKRQNLHPSEQDLRNAAAQAAMAAGLPLRQDPP